MHRESPPLDAAQPLKPVSARLDRQQPSGDLVDDASVLIWTCDAQGRCGYFNRGWLAFTGHSLEQASGLGWMEPVHAEDQAWLLETFQTSLAAQSAFKAEFRLRRCDGVYRWVVLTIVPRLAEGSVFGGFVATCVDIHEYKCVHFELENLLTASEEAQARLTEQTERLHRLADSDPLTGVLNRRSFRERFEREWSRSLRHERELACIMLDIDFFKKINDTHGHTVGDSVLKRVAQSLKEHVRPSDLVCRYGGEEFCILAPETDEEGAAILAERLRVKLAEMKIDAGSTTITACASLGVAQRTSLTEDVESLIDCADQALQVAKHTGRNRVVRFACDSSLADALMLEGTPRILSELTAKDLVIPTPCVHYEETIGRAIELFLRHGVGSAPVIDNHGKLVGFLSERDLMMLSVTPETWARKVHEVMKTNVVSYEESTPGQQVFQFLCRVSIHRIVVVRAGRPVGIISPASLLTAFQKRVLAEPRCVVAGA